MVGVRNMYKAAGGNMENIFCQTCPRGAKLSTKGLLGNQQQSAHAKYPTLKHHSHPIATGHVIPIGSRDTPKWEWHSFI